MASILCVGSVGTDFTVWPFALFPPRNQLQLVEEIQLGVGGCAANVSIVMSRLGAGVKLIGRVGADFAGEYTLSQLRNDGIDVSNIVLEETERTGTTIVLVFQDGERSFIFSPGANRNLQGADVPAYEFKHFDAIHFSDVFLLPKLDGAPTINLLKRAKAEGLVTSLDTSWDPAGRWMKVLREYLPHLNLFFTNVEEASNLLPGLDPTDMVSEFLRLGVGTAILKLGRDGCLVGHSSHESFSIVPNTISPLDTTGAGDTFAGTFVCAFLEGMSLRKSAILATRLAEDCILSLGATSGIKRFSSVQELSEYYDINET